MSDHDHAQLLEFTSEIVSSHVAHTAVPTDDLPGIISSVHTKLSELGRTPEEPEPRQPAVPIKKSVTADSVVCLECGRSRKMLRRHLMTDHRLSPNQYRERWSLPPDHPLTAPNYSAYRQQLAKRLGLGRKRHERKGRAKRH